MLTLSTRPAATRVAGSRRCIASPTPVIASSSRRRSVPRKTLDRTRLAAVPDDQNTGRRMGGPQDVSVGSDIPSSDTNPDMDPAEKYSDREGAEGVVHFAESGKGGSDTQTKSDNRQQEGGPDVSDMITDLSGGAKAAANRVTDAIGGTSSNCNSEQMTGTRPGGPQDVSVGSDVPSSDTHPHMDPAESDTYTEREEKSDAPNPKPSGSSSSSSSDMSAGGGRYRETGSSGSSSGATQGTMRLDGRVSANEVDLDSRIVDDIKGSQDALLSSAASGGSSSSSRGGMMSADEGRGFAGSGRDLSDMLNKSPGASSSSSSSSSSKGQQDQDSDSDRTRESEESPDSTTPRAHPVARTAGTAAASAAGTIIGAAAGPVGAAAGAAIGAAIGRRAADMMGGREEQGEIYDKGEEPDQVAEELRSAGSEIREAAHSAQAKASEMVDRASERISSDSGGSASHRSDTRSVQGSPYESRSAQTSGSGSGSSSNVSDLSRSGSDHARSASSKVSGGTRSAADRVAGAAESLKETAADAGHKAAHKIGDAADRIPLPEFPPSSDRDQGDRLEDDRTVQAGKERVSGAAESARDKVESATEEVKDRAQSAAGAAKERLGGAGDRAAGAADSTARTAADYSSKTSEGLQEMSNKGQGNKESSEGDWGSSTSRAEWGSSSTAPTAKSDAGPPMDNDIAHGLGAAAAAGGYGDVAADLEVDSVRSKSKDTVGAYATRGLGEPEAGYRKGGGEDLTAPEGRLAAGGSDAQAAVSTDPEILSKVGTSDSTAERIAEMYGVGPEATSGSQEAEMYRAEADPDRKPDTA